MRAARRHRYGLPPGCAVLGEPLVSRAAAPREARLSPPPVFRANGLADLTLRSATLRHVAMVLDYADGQVTWAAQELGVAESTIRRMLSGECQRPHLRRRARMAA